MPRIAALAAVLLTCAAAPAAAPVRTLDHRTLTPAAIDAEVTRLMAANKVTGLGVALIRDGRVVFAKSYGQRDTDHELLRNDTIIYGASLTKATFATYVMQLVGEGKLDLDVPIDRYLPKPLPDYERYADLAGDPRWKKLTLRMLLNHTSGFANLRFFEDDKKLKFHRDPGVRFGYSGEGINLAQFVVEQYLGLDTAAEMQRRLFDPLGMTRTSMVWQDRFNDGNVSMMFPEDAPPHNQKARKRAGAAGSLVTTLDDWSRFLAAVARGDLLTASARAALVKTSVLIDSPTMFPTLTDTRTDKWRAIGLGYAVGWGRSRRGTATPSTRRGMTTGRPTTRSASTGAATAFCCCRTTIARKTSSCRWSTNCSGRSACPPNGRAIGADPAGALAGRIKSSAASTS